MKERLKKLLKQPGGEQGSSLVAALLAMMILSTVGIMITLTVAEDVMITRNQVESIRCLYIAGAGLNFAMKKISGSPSWAGLPPPGRAVGGGYFTISVSDSADGSPLPSGQKRINIKGYLDSAEREIEVIAQ
jgi:hypothetical protein